MCNVDVLACVEVEPAKLTANPKESPLPALAPGGRPPKREIAAPIFFEAKIENIDIEKLSTEDKAEITTALTDSIVKHLGLRRSWIQVRLSATAKLSLLQMMEPSDTLTATAKISVSKTLSGKVREQMKTNKAKIKDDLLYAIDQILVSNDVRGNSSKDIPEPDVHEVSSKEMEDTTDTFENQEVTAEYRWTKEISTLKPELRKDFGEPNVGRIVKPEQISLCNMHGYTLEMMVDMGVIVEAAPRDKRRRMKEDKKNKKTKQKKKRRRKTKRENATARSQNATDASKKPRKKLKIGKGKGREGLGNGTTTTTKEQYDQGDDSIKSGSTWPRCAVVAQLVVNAMWAYFYFFFF